MDFGWGGNLNMNFGRMPSRFDEQYHCYSLAHFDKAQYEGGDKIFLPQSALDTIARLQVDWPILLRLQSPDHGTMTHCGVCEFTAPEGCCYIPYWMMQNLLIEEGSVISISNVSLPKATFVKLQWQHEDFLEITNPKAVLEHALRSFSCVTKGAAIQLPFNNKNYHFEVKEVKPQDAACIIETDCVTEFEAPPWYEEPSSVNSSRSNSQHGGGAGLAEALANIPKQSAYSNNNRNNSSCPSPALSSVSGTLGVDRGIDDTGKDEANKLRIVDGKIVRPHTSNDENDNNIQCKKEEDISMMANATGATGVQRNAAIAIAAPQVDYWAINAGDGARLDGKKPNALKDSQGNEIDVRKLRAEAAAKRLEAMKKEGKEISMPSSGKMVNGKTATVGDNTNCSGDSGTANRASTESLASKRKSRIGSKYSKLKQSGGFAFQGSANTFNK